MDLFAQLSCSRLFSTVDDVHSCPNPINYAHKSVRRAVDQVLTSLQSQCFHSISLPGKGLVALVRHPVYVGENMAEDTQGVMVFVVVN
jgi:hypothetical protein